MPHTEIGALLVNNRKTDFSYKVLHQDVIHVLPLPIPTDPCRPSLLRPHPLQALSFLTDVNVAKLCSLLRMAGFDCICPKHLDDAGIATAAVQEGRILLTRDREMLKRKIIIHGHMIRAHLPVEQLKEILELYGLQDKTHPFSRCIECNTLLSSIAKEKILHRLEPLTKQYYQKFFHCPGCDKIYWSGSHKSGMEKLSRKVLE